MSKEEMTLCAEHVEHMLWCQSLAMPCLVEQLADLRFFIEMLGAVLAWGTIQHSPSPLPTKFKYIYRYRYIHPNIQIQIQFSLDKINSANK